MRTLVMALVGCCCALAARADWLDSKEAADFRDRVVQLALFYGQSSGIDLQGHKVVTRELRKVDAKCSDVEVTTSKDGKVERRETVQACRKH